MSLQTGETVAVLTNLLIEPGNLELVAFRCEAGRTDLRQPLLLVQDIRQIALDCIVIDSEDELIDADDIVRLKNLLAENFTLQNKPVITDLGRRLGHVEDYTINLETSRLQKLYVKRPLWRSWLGASLIIDRSQIVDITPRHILVRDTTIKSPALAAEPVPETHP